MIHDASRLAGDVDYAVHGAGYAVLRRTDPRIEARVHAALGSARSVINVGAGGGSYEPADRYVVAVEPSAAMRAQRPGSAVPALDAAAERLPFDDDSFDAAMATVTVHQWSDVVAGLRELRRVARGPVVVLTFDATALDRLWLAEYCPELVRVEARRFPPIELIAEHVGDAVRVEEVPVALDCVDGFAEAYYGRPERFLDPAVRRSQSAWSFVPEAEHERAVERLRADLASGAWDERHGHLRTQPEFAGSLRLVVGTPG
jgi:SAM-dependent methyltransferase